MAPGPASTALVTLLCLSGVSLVDHARQLKAWIGRDGFAMQAEPVVTVTQQCAGEKLQCPDCLCSCTAVFYPSSDNFSSSVWPECGVRSPGMLAFLLSSYLLIIVLTVSVTRKFLRPTIVRSFAFPHPVPSSPRTESDSGPAVSRPAALGDSPLRRAGVVTPKSRR